MINQKSVHAAFIGSAGVPNCYGGFEAFLEFCGPHISKEICSLQVTCDAALYEDHALMYRGMRRKFIKVRANGGLSILHDLVAFFSVFSSATHIVVLGISGAPWFPLFRCLCGLTGKRLLVNIDGIEWRREKFGVGKRLVLRAFDWLAQRCAHVVIYDNNGLWDYVFPFSRTKAVEIAYSGDHVLRLTEIGEVANTALTICRIEPENQLELLIEGALLSTLQKYTIVGNWNNSDYGCMLRNRFSSESRLALLDPIYDQKKLAELRESCAIYLHGHSVGGTNPSLVEMLFYDSHIICFDVSFNRFTAGKAASYFYDAQSLKKCIDGVNKGYTKKNLQDRQILRSKYLSRSIANNYLEAFCHVDII